MLTFTARIIAISTSADGADVDLVVGPTDLSAEVSLDIARALGAHLGEDLELVLRVPGEPITPSAPPETTAGATRAQETPCADREAGGGPDQPRTVTNTPGRAAPARASKRSKRSKGRTIAACDDCGETAAIKARGLCDRCYQRRLRDKKQRGKRRSNLRRLVHHVGAEEAAERLSISREQVAAWLDDDAGIPGDTALTLAHEISRITKARRRRAAGQDEPIFSDRVKAPTLDDLAGAQRP